MTVVAVTGVTGWLGRAAAEVAAASGHDVRGFASSASTVWLDQGGELDVRPLAELPQTPHDVLLHYAFLTREQVGRVGHEEYVRANASISRTVLDALAAQTPAALVHASSGAAVSRGSLGEDPYGALKAADEIAFANAAPRCLNLRVFNVSGPWITKPSGFAISDLLVQAAEGGPVRLAAGNPVVRSYVDVEDLAFLALAWAFSDEPTLTVETAGEREVELGELAEDVIDLLGPSDRTIERPHGESAAPDRYVGSAQEFRELASRLGVRLRPLSEQLRRTAEALGIEPPT